MAEEKVVFILLRLWPKRPMDESDIFGVYEDPLDASEAMEQMGEADPFLMIVCKPFITKDADSATET